MEKVRLGVRRAGPFPVRRANSPDRLPDLAGECYENTGRSEVFVASQIADGFDSHTGKQFVVLFGQAGKSRGRGRQDFVQSRVLEALSNALPNSIETATFMSFHR